MSLTKEILNDIFNKNLDAAHKASILGEYAAPMKSLIYKLNDYRLKNGMTKTKIQNKYTPELEDYFQQFTITPSKITKGIIIKSTIASFDDIDKIELNSDEQEVANAIRNYGGVREKNHEYYGHSMGGGRRRSKTIRSRKTIRRRKTTRRSRH